MNQMDLETVQLFVETFHQNFPCDPNPDSGNCTTHARALAESFSMYQATFETNEHLDPNEYIREYILNPQNFFPRILLSPTRVGPSSLSKYSDFLIHPMSKSIAGSGMQKITTENTLFKSSFETFRYSKCDVAVVETNAHAYVAVRTNQGIFFADSQSNLVVKAEVALHPELSLFDASEIDLVAQKTIDDFYAKFDATCEAIASRDGPDAFTPLDDWRVEDFLSNRQRIMQVFLKEIERDQSVAQAAFMQAATSNEHGRPRLNLESADVDLPKGEAVIVDKGSIFGVNITLNTGKTILDINSFDTYVGSKPTGNYPLIAYSAGVKISPASLTPAMPAMGL